MENVNQIYTDPVQFASIITGFDFDYLLFQDTVNEDRYFTTAFKLNKDGSIVRDGNIATTEHIEIILK